MPRSPRPAAALEYYYTGLHPRAVVLNRPEIDGDLPDVCLCCGKRATVRREKTFLTHQVRAHVGTGLGALVALGFLLGDVVQAASSPRLQLQAPFCSAHRNHWEQQKWITWGGIAALVFVLLSAIPLIVLAALSKGMLMHGLAVLLPTAGIIAVVIGFFLCLKRTVRPLGATPDYLILGNVSEEFIDALEEQRQQRELRPAGGRESDIPMALPARPSGGTQTATKRYQEVADRLTRGQSPESIENDLIDQGMETASARHMVHTVLEELPPMLRQRYGSGRYAGPLIAGVGLLLLLVALIAGMSGKVFVPGWLFGPPALYFGGIWAVMAYWKIGLARRLEGFREEAPLAIPVVTQRAEGLKEPPAFAIPVAESVLTEGIRSKPARLPPGSGSAGPLPPPGTLRRPLACGAIQSRETARIRFVGLLGLAGFFVLMPMMMCGGIRWVDHRDSVRHDGPPVAEQPKRQEDPNGPDPNEGPPPAGWTVLFRSDDPAVWNTNSPGERFALPVKRAHSTIRYLRLKRLDTGDFLIIRITHKQLAREDRPNPAKGAWWNGTAALEWNARHLGIVQVPPAPTRERGVVGIAGEGFHVLTGSGFGGRCLIDDGTWCAWRGQAIPRTVFEIAVTVGPLTEAEKGQLLR
jgi:membrane protein YqaA with SNARE-associated domain